MKRAVLIGLLGAALGLGGCSEDETEPGSSAKSQDTPRRNEQGESAGDKEKAPEPAAPTAEQVPVAEDFEAETKTQITKENYEKKLDQLAQQIEETDGGS